MRTIHFKTNLCVALLSLGLLSVGCGGKTGGSSTTPKDVAVDASGNVVKSSSGTAVTKKAEKRWTKAMAAYDAAEKAGWTKDSCSDVSDKFEDANSAAGGKFAEAIFMAGLAIDKCKDREGALKFYEKTLAVDPKFCKARVGVGLMQLKRGNREAAFATFQKAVRDDARCTEGYTNLAILQALRGGAQADEALNNLRRALAIEAQYLPAFNQMAQLFLSKAQDNKKMLDLAAVVCRQAQLIEPNYAPIYNTWGLINMRKEAVLDALRMFEKAFQLDSNMFEAYMNFGQITLSFRGYADAKGAFSKAVELEPKSYDAHIGLGAALRGLGDTAGAEKEYAAAIKIKGNRPEAHFNLGLLYQDYKSGSVKDMKAALGHYKKFVSLAGSDDRYKKAVQDIERKCNFNSKRKRRRKRSSKKCRPGRKQNLNMAIEAMAAMAEMNASSGGTPPEGGK